MFSTKTGCSGCRGWGGGGEKKKPAQQKLTQRSQVVKTHRATTQGNAHLLLMVSPITHTNDAETSGLQPRWDFFKPKNNNFMLLNVHSKHGA